MRILAIETSERVGTLATLESTEEGVSIAAAVTLPTDQRSARSLLPTIKTLLADCHWHPKQLDLIAVTTGPGSFTGLRIGVTTAKTLAYATGAKLTGVHTLAAMAAGVGIIEQQLWTILDAQRQELFVAQFKPHWQEATPDTRVVSTAEWLQAVRPGDMVTGPPLKKLAERLPEGVRIADEKNWPPRAECVGHLALAADQRGEVTDAMQLVPRYYRKSAAEEKAEA